MPTEPDSTAELLEDRVVSLAPVREQPAPPPVRWILVAGVLVVAIGAAVVSARWSSPPLAAVASPSPSITLSAPTPAVAATIQPTASPDNGPCGAGHVQFQVNAQPVPMEGLEAIRVPVGGTLALAIQEESTSGSLVLARAHAGAPATTDTGVIATFTGTDFQPGAVTPVGWSANGDALLVSAGHASTSGDIENCNDLFLLQAEGSSVQLSSLTDDGSTAPVEGGALSAGGARVAYFQQNELRPQIELRSIDVHSGKPGIGVAGCSGPLGVPRWSPDETKILAICNNTLVIADVDLVTWHTFPTPSPDVVYLTAGWRADSTSIVAVGAQTGQMGSSPLEIFEFDAVTGTGGGRAASLTNTTWVLGSASMSPDGRWALVQGNDTYAIDTATGTATNLPWIVLPNPFDLATVAWLSGSNSFLYANSGALYQVDLAAMTRTDVGAIPVSNFAWHESKP